jgi:hypothetical protein
VEVFTKIEVVFKDIENASDKALSTWLYPPFRIFVKGSTMATPILVHDRIEIPSQV